MLSNRRRIEDEQWALYRTQVVANSIGANWEAPNLLAGADETRAKGSLGWYCNGSGIKECTNKFGEHNLERMCSTCPD